MRRRTLLQTLAAGPASLPRRLLGETARPGPVVATASGRLRGQSSIPGMAGRPYTVFWASPCGATLGANRLVAPRRAPWTELSC